MFIQAVVSSLYPSTPSNIDRALLLSVATISTNQLRSLANIRGSGDFSRVVDEKGCELQEFGNRNTNIFHPITESLSQMGFCREAKHKIHSSKQYSSIKCDFLEDPSQSSDLNPTEMLWKNIKYKINTFTNPCKYVIKFHVIVQLQTSDQIKILKNCNK